MNHICFFLIFLNMFDSFLPFNNLHWHHCVKVIFHIIKSKLSQNEVKKFLNMIHVPRISESALEVARKKTLRNLRESIPTLSRMSIRSYERKMSLRLYQYGQHGQHQYFILNGITVFCYPDTFWKICAVYPSSRANA